MCVLNFYQSKFDMLTLLLNSQLHPKSENLSEMVRGIVSRLEMNFEDVAARMKTTPGLGTTWRDDALSNTLSEIPRIPMAGTETGVIPGFGTHIYAPAGTIDFSKTVSVLEAMHNNSFSILI